MRARGQGTGGRKRVLFLLHGSDFAGTQKHLVALIDYADTQAVDITVVSLRDHFPAEIKRKYHQVDFQEYDLTALRSWMEWLGFLLKHRAHAVVFVETWFTDFTWQAIFMAWLLTRGHVYMTEHSETPVDAGRGRYRFTIRGVLSKRVLAVSRGVKERLVKHYGYPESKIEVAQFPIDAARFAPLTNDHLRIRNQLHIPSSDIVIIVVSRLVKEKAVAKAIEAFELAFNSTRRDIWLWIVGDGELRKDLEQSVMQRGIAERVIFFGRRANVEEYLQESDIFILSSEIEAYGVALLEAMSVGLVCIATDTLGARELLPDRRFLVAHSGKSIFQALRDILTMDRIEMDAIKRSTREHVSLQFNREREAIQALSALGVPSAGTRRAGEIR